LRRLWLSKISGRAVYVGSSLALAWPGLSRGLWCKNANKFRINL
jgi:hypothetical protein